MPRLRRSRLLNRSGNANRCRRVQVSDLGDWVWTPLVRGGVNKRGSGRLDRFGSADSNPGVKQRRLQSSGSCERGRVNPPFKVPSVPSEEYRYSSNRETPAVPRRWRLRERVTRFPVWIQMHLQRAGRRLRGVKA